jgi:hypothetical protein
MHSANFRVISSKIAKRRETAIRLEYLNGMKHKPDVRTITRREVGKTPTVAE